MALAAQDIAEITQLYAAYNVSVDDGDGDAFAACFVADGSLVADGNPITGTSALAEFARSVPTGLPGIRHLGANVSVIGDGSQAAGRSYLTVLIAGAQPQLLMTGRYRDTLRREAAGWRFVRRDFQADR
jgi:uncharacterized protein (TIGR02246 family)